MENYHKTARFWAESSVFDEKTRAEVAALTDEKEIEDRFYKDLEFGTAGLRGIMGAGTNRINPYTVGRATAGLAKFLLATDPDAKKKGVAIGFDTRNQSDVLARSAADILTAFGIPVYLYDQPVPTPALSFAVRYLGCVSGVVLTASHNPPAYNGYKAYDATGCQLGVQESLKVTEYVENTRFEEIPSCKNDALLTMIGDDVLDAFTNAVLASSVAIPASAKEALKIVYTPIHGTGRKPVQQILKKDGFTDVVIVPEQEKPDGNFPTVKSPNPEERGALKMGMDLAQKNGADLLIGTDPDADRIGCAVRHNGNMELISGNQMGILLVDFLCRKKRDPKKNNVFIKTVVTGDLSMSIAQKYGCEMIEVLTGFRFIGQKVTGFEKEKAERLPNAHEFLLGFEESYGYLAGTHARDKDSVVAAMLIAEMTALHKSEGKTLIDALDAIYAEYGYCLDTVNSFTLQGKEGIERIGEIMKELRASHDFLPGVVRFADYSRGVSDLPKSNVLKFYFASGSWLVARPSGTEPKIKFYFYSIGKDREDAAAKNEKICQDILAKIQEVE